MKCEKCNKNEATRTGWCEFCDMGLNQTQRMKVIELTESAYDMTWSDVQGVAMAIANMDMQLTDDILEYVNKNAKKEVE